MYDIMNLRIRKESPADSLFLNGQVFIEIEAFLWRQLWKRKKIIVT